MITKERMSYSFASKLLNNSFEQIRYDLVNPKEPTDTMNKGSRAEYVLINGLDDLQIGATTKTKGEKFKKELERLKGESELYQNHPYLVVTEQEFADCEMMFNHISPEVKAIVEGADSQAHEEDVICNTVSHGYADLLLKDCVVEVKFSDSDPVAFGKQVMNMNWDIQCYVYTELFQREFRWLVINNKAPFLMTVFSLPDDKFYQSGKNKFEKACGLFRDFNAGEKSPVFQSLDAPYWAK